MKFMVSRADAFRMLECLQEIPDLRFDLHFGPEGARVTIHNDLHRPEVYDRLRAAGIERIDIIGSRA